MKTVRPFTIFVSALIGGGLLGTALRAVLFKPPHENDHSPSPATLATDRSILTGRSVKTSTGPALLNSSDTVAERFLNLATRAEAASADEMLDLLRLAKLEGNRDLERAIAARWAALDPSHMFQTLTKSGEDNSSLFKVLFKEWVSSNPREALDEFVSTPDAKHHFANRLFLWSELMLQAPEIGIEASSQFDVNSFSVSLRKLRSWAEGNPQKAAAKVIEHVNDQYVRDNLMTEIGQVWGSHDPETALRYAASLEPKFGKVLSKNVVRAWIEKDPDAAAAFVEAETDPAMRAELGEGVAAGLAKSDPLAALTWAQENLRSVSRAEAISDIVRTLAKEDIQAAGELVAGMDPGGGMNRAVTELIFNWGRHADLSENETMFHWIGSLSDTEARHKAMEAMEWRISTFSKTGLLDFVTGAHGHLATASMIRRAAEQRARQDPASATAWAQGLPEDRSTQAIAAVTATLKALSQER